MTTKRATLAGRRRIQEMAHAVSTVEAKREELLALKGAGNDPQPAVDVEPKTPVAKHQDEVRGLVSKLQVMYEDISTRGNSNRLEFSRQMQHDMLVTEIRKQMLELADRFSTQGLNIDKVRLICQAFVDDVRIGLSSVGIYINPLYVRKLRGRLAATDC